MKFTLTLLFLLFLGIIPAQSIYEPAGATNLASGNTALFNGDVWHVFNNPAAASLKRQIAFGLANERNSFIPEYTRSMLGINFPLYKWYVGIGFAQSGIIEFNKQEILLSMAMPLHSKFVLGTQTGIELVNATGYEKKWYVLTGIGGQYQLSKATKLGLYIFNPPAISQYEKFIGMIPVIIRMGISHQFNHAVSGQVALHQQLTQQVVWHSGLKYAVNSTISLYAGTSNGTTLFSFGTSMQSAKCLMSCGCAMFAYTGNKISLDLQYRLP